MKEEVLLDQSHGAVADAAGRAPRTTVAASKGHAMRTMVRAAPHDMDVAVILVDSTGKIVFVNALAETFLSRNDCLTADGIHIGGSRTPALRRLRRAIAQCTCSAAAPASLAPVEITADHDATTLRVTFTQLGRNTIGLGGSRADVTEPVTLLLIHDQVQQGRAMRRKLCERFGLTVAEAGVVMELIEGGGREGVARRLGVSVATVRTHLMRIFDKTGVRRQAELVRLVLNSDRLVG